MSCAASKERVADKAAKSTLSQDCSDRVVCEHLSEDHFVYRNNMIVRAGEVRWAQTSLMIS